jgi:hypothetical protein
MSRYAVCRSEGLGEGSDRGGREERQIEKVAMAGMVEGALGGFGEPGCQHDHLTPYLVAQSSGPSGRVVDE